MQGYKRRTNEKLGEGSRGRRGSRHRLLPPALRAALAETLQCSQCQHVLSPQPLKHLLRVSVAPAGAEPRGCVLLSVCKRVGWLAVQLPTKNKPTGPIPKTQSFVGQRLISSLASHVQIPPPQVWSLSSRSVFSLT